MTPIVILSDSMRCIICEGDASNVRTGCTIFLVWSWLVRPLLHVWLLLGVGRLFYNLHGIISLKKNDLHSQVVHLDSDNLVGR
jgi:hypothetical protein